MTIKTEIGRRIAKTRNEKGLTLSALSEKTEKSFSVSRISNWERGLRSPGPAEAATLAKALGVAPSFLLCLTDNPQGEINVDNVKFPLMIPVIDFNDIPVSVEKLKDHIQAAPLFSENIEIATFGTNQRPIKDDLIFATRIIDNSMQPDISSNDLLFINIDRKPNPSDLVLAYIPDQNKILIRKLKETSGSQFQLCATNDDWANIELQALNECVLLGTIMEQHVIF